jgi:hypothetical protein
MAAQVPASPEPVTPGVLLGIDKQPFELGFPGDTGCDCDPSISDLGPGLKSFSAEWGAM